MVNIGRQRVAICSVCGNPNGQCCKLSKWMSEEDFASRYFGARLNDDYQYVNREGEVLPLHILREFRDDYRTSGMSFTAYKRSTQGRDDCVAVVYKTANAAELVRRFNCHEKMLAALEEANRLYSSYGLLAQTQECGAWINTVRDAIAKAKEE